MTPSHTIQVQGLEKSYQDVDVLRGVDLDVARGSILALLGSNGSGKSTVARVVTGLIPAASGTLRFEGADITGLPAWRIARLGAA